MKKVLLLVIGLLSAFGVEAQGVAPDAGEYEMTVTLHSVKNSNRHKARGGSFFEILLRNASDTESQLFYKNMDDVDEGRTISGFGSQRVLFPANINQRAKGLHFKAYYNVRNSSSADRSSDNEIEFSASFFPCFERTYQDSESSFPRMVEPAYWANLSLSIKPKALNLFLQNTELQIPGQTGSYFLPGGKQIIIKATTDFPREVYQWQYQKNNGSWESFDSRFISWDGSELSFCAEDFLSMEEILDKIPFDVRISGTCITSGQVLKFMPRASAPRFKQVDELNHENCVNSNDGSAVISLSRDLFPNESVELLSILDENDPNHVEEFDYEIIRPDKVRVKDLPPGTYRFRILGNYVDQHGATVSLDAEGEGYFFGITIEPAKPLTFVVTGRKDITCTGGNDGQISVHVDGGSPPYRIVCENDASERWQSDDSDSDNLVINGLPAAEYRIWVDYGNGCSGEDLFEYVVLEEPEESVEIGRREIFRPLGDASNGMIEVEVINGLAPYSAVWRTGGPDGASLPADKIRLKGPGNCISLLENVEAGTYYVEFADLKGCVISEIITLVALPPFNIDLQENRGILCAGETTGELEINVRDGGEPPYTYEWYKFEDPYRYKVGTGRVLSNIPTGQYQVKITDQAGNVVWTSLIEQTEEPAVNVGFTTEKLRCHGDNDGFLEAELSGGISPYSYLWLTGNPGYTGLRIDNLTAGLYDLEVTDGNGCRRVIQGTVSEPDRISVGGQIVHPSCFDLSNGKIQLDVQGGNDPYGILWEGGQTSFGLGNLHAGDYLVTITDGNGCESVEKMYTLQEPPAILLTAGQIKPVTEFGVANGSASYFIEGGTPSYQVVCRKSTGQTYFSKTVLNAANEKVKVDFPSLAEGHYVVTVSDSKYNLAYPGGCVVKDEFDITQPPPLSVTINENRYITCYKGNDGELVANVVGGVPGYDYYWYLVEGAGRRLLEEKSDTLRNVAQGKYVVEIVDQNGIRVSNTYNLLHLNPIIISFSTAVLKCSDDTDGWAKANVTGGAGFYGYLWSTGDTTDSIKNLTGGFYKLSVTDARGCTVLDSANVTSPKKFIIQTEVFAPVCAGNKDAAINVGVTGGTQPYTFLWSTGHTGQFLENIYPGDYSLIVKDVQGCGEKFTFAVPETYPITIDLKEMIEPRAYQYSDGKLSIEINGGTAPYWVVWTNEEGQEILSELVDTQETRISTISNLSEGTYSVRIEDHNYADYLEDNDDPEGAYGCYSVTSFYLPEPPLLEVSVENTQIISCHNSNDGILIAHAQGGVPFKEGLPYDYSWYKEGRILQEKDSVLSGIGAGNYWVDITDANGILVSSQKFYLSQPELLQLSLSAADLKCSRDQNGWVEAKVTGGTLPYSYNWSTGDSLTRIENVPRGKYFLFLSDAHGCEITGNVSIIQPGGITAQVEMIPPVCYNGSDGEIRVTLSGGQAPYSYSWDNGDQSLSHRGLAAGLHSMTVTDVNECSHEVFTYNLTQPDSIIINLGRDWELCKDQTIEVNARIAEPVNTYYWFNEANNQIGSNPFIVLKDAGTYRAEVLTAKGCKGAGTIKITRADNEIAADFIIATQVPIHEDVFVVNISKPEPDKIEWILPESDKLEVLNSNEDNLVVIFSDYGEYTIGMRSFSGNCEKTVYKTVRVKNKHEIEDYEDTDEPVLKQFAISPNPNQGNFDVKIELKEKFPVVLTVVDSGTGKMMEKRQLSGENIYSEHFRLPNAGTGIYLLNLYTIKTNSVQKVVVYSR